MILPKLRALLRDGDQLLFSANPGSRPGLSGRGGARPAAVRQRGNARLVAVFFDGDWRAETTGELFFGIEPVDELLRIVAIFKFTQSQAIELEGERVAFDVGQSLRLFFPTATRRRPWPSAWSSTACRSCLARSPSPGRREFSGWCCWTNSRRVRRDELRRWRLPAQTKSGIAGGIVFKPAGHRVAGFVRQAEGMRQLNRLNAQPSRLACQRQLPLCNEPSGELNMDGQDGQDVFW